MYSIYEIKNLINDKRYVGFTNNIKRRWNQHRNRSKNICKTSYAIHRALHKYGIENFSFTEIDTAENLEEANIKEIFWIKNRKENGFILYNETNGGEGARGCKWNKKQLDEEQIQKIIIDYTINKSSSRELSKKYNFKCHKSIIKILKDNNIQIRSQKDSAKLKEIIFSPQQQEYILSQYKKPEITLVDLSKVIGYDPKTIKKFLIKQNAYNKQKLILSQNIL